MAKDKNKITNEIKSHLWVLKYFICGFCSFMGLFLVTPYELFVTLLATSLKLFIVFVPRITALLFSASNATQYPKKATKTNMNIASIQIMIALVPPAATGVLSTTALKMVTNTKIMVMKMATLAFASPGGMTKLAQEAITQRADVDI